MTSSDLQNGYNFPKVISLFLDSRSMSIRQGGELLGVSHSVLSRILHAQADPTFATLKKFSSASGLSIDSILNTARILCENTDGNYYLVYTAIRIDTTHWRLELCEVGHQPTDCWYKTPQNKWVIVILDRISDRRYVYESAKLPDNLFNMQSLVIRGGNSFLETPSKPIYMTHIPIR